MADSAKKEKIAAAKKKLRQFQQKGVRNGSPTPNKPKKNGVSGTPNQSSHPGTPATSTPMNNSHDHQNDGASNSVYSTPLKSPGAERTTASTEQLHQLSRQINGLITQSGAYLNNEDVDNGDSSSIEDLESRNRQLASLLEQHSQANEQLHKQLKELKERNAQMQSSLAGEKKGVEDKTSREIKALKDQLQVHIQTIGILVAEKTELASSLNQTQKSGEQRLRENEELSGRLKASRQRVAELERSFTTASSTSQKHEQTVKEYSKDVDRLKLELYKLNKSNEELTQQTSELQEKLQKKVAESAALEDSLIDVKGRLEMSELHVTQLTNGGQSSDNTEQLDQLVQERSDLLAKVSQYEESFHSLDVERHQMTQQYQQYTEQLNAQSQLLAQQVKELSEERELLLSRQQDLETSISELQNREGSLSIDASEASKAKETFEAQVEKLTAENGELSHKLQAQVTDNSQLSKLISEKEERIVDLELTVQRLSDNSVDHESLLESMQSDKTALSRALAQNKELKTQLAELQNGFVKMSNDNMDMMTKLTSEQHIAKELAERLSHQEDELKDIREQLSQKDQELKDLHDKNAFVADVEGYTQDQLEDRMRHLEAKSQLVETLHREINHAQDTINSLTSQNTQLQSQLAQVQDGASESEGSPLHRVDSLSASIQQLEMERNQIMTQFHSEQEEKEKLSLKLKTMEQDLISQVPATLNGDVISKPQFEALQHAMKQLEVKFSSSMRDKADLQDQNEQLEHIILQLQGETDTIGEYVALYQQQRYLLKQRQVEKDQYISQLARQREDLTDKLGQLQALVMQLLGDRQMLHSYQNNVSSVPNHLDHSTNATTPTSQARSAQARKLENSNLEDWPDYSSDSDASEVEPIIAGGDSPAVIDTSHTTAPNTSPQSPHSSSSPPQDNTAQQIMHLLTELGHSNLVDRNTYLQERFIHCTNCTGQLLTV